MCAGGRCDASSLLALPYTIHWVGTPNLPPTKRTDRTKWSGQRREQKKKPTKSTCNFTQRILLYRGVRYCGIRDLKDADFGYGKKSGREWFCILVLIETYIRMLTYNLL